MTASNTAVVIVVNAAVPPLTVRPARQRPLLFSMASHAAGWIGLWVAPLTVPWLWMIPLAIGLGTFAMVLPLMGLRARTPETTAALHDVPVVAGTEPPVRGPAPPPSDGSPSR